MGIKSNFNKFLKDTCPQVFNDIHLSELSFQKVAIDISIYVHKYKAVCGDRWLSSLLNLIVSLRRNELHCIFVFDGKAPPEKVSEQQKRREEKDKMEDKLYILEQALDKYYKTGDVDSCLKDLYNKRRSPSRKTLMCKKKGINMNWVINKIEQKRSQLYSISSADFENVRVMLDILNVPYITAPDEAEKLCAKLCIDGDVSAVLSEDSDVIAYGCPLFCTKIDTSKDTCVMIKCDDVLSGLELDYNSFLDFCILCGTDYNSNIPKVGSKTSYKYITKYKTIENIEENEEIDVSILNFVRVRELFSQFADDIYDIPFCGKPDFDKLQEFMRCNNLPQMNFENLKKHFTTNIIVFDE